MPKGEATSFNTRRPQGFGLTTAFFKRFQVGFVSTRLTWQIIVLCSIQIRLQTLGVSRSGTSEIRKRGSFCSLRRGGSELNLNKWTREAKGFSLLEVLIALVFLAVGLLALAMLQVTSLRGNTFSQHLTRATLMAQDRLEFLKNLPLNSNRLLRNQYDDQRVTLSGISFERTYSVTEEDNIKTIQYTVSWNDGRNHSVTFATCRGQ